MKLTDSQRSILKAASTQPKTDVREFMSHIKSPPIRDQVVNAMLNNGLVAQDPDAESVAYIISEAGIVAIGKKMPPAPMKDAAEEQQDAAVPETEAKAPAKKREPKPKREGASKKQVMIDLMSREEGATVGQLMEATGWLKHSVHGAKATLNQELIEKRGLAITSTKGDGEERVYRVVKHEPAEPAKEEEVA